MADKLEILQELAQDVDFDLGSIGLNIETLSDVEELFGQLIMGINEALHRGELVTYRQHHTALRVYYELIRYSLVDLKANYEKVHKLNCKLIENIEQLMKGESHSAGNTAALNKA